MEPEKGGRRANPKLTAGLFDRFIFGWMFPIFKIGKNRNIEPKDLYDVLPENLSGPVTDKLEKYWKDECAAAAESKTKPSLFRATRKMYQRDFLKYAIHFFCLHIIVKTLEPLAMGLLILHFDNGASSNLVQGFGYASTFLLLTFLDQILFNHSLFGMRIIGISARVSCASLIYRKIMKLPSSMKQSQGGKITTLLANDVAKLEFSFLFVHTLWLLPIQLVIITSLIWYNVGCLPALMGVLALLLQTVPVQSCSGMLIAKFRRQIAMKTDERIQLTDEIIHGIRLIKMYTWEKPFKEFLFLARRYEIQIIAKSYYLRNLFWAITSFAQRTPLFIAVTIYVLQGNVITAYTMFTLIQYFNILHVMTGAYFLRSVYTLGDAVASIRRIQEFLLLPEKNSFVKRLAANDEDEIITLNGVSATSDENSEIQFLREINLGIHRNLLYAVVGPVGAGKSSLLKLLLDELTVSTGNIHVRGEVSFASQDPWLFKGTIKSNILFGAPYNEKKYEEITRICALLEDFEQLPHGDETLVGESGANLSGGQCARISLARAIYRQADIYLLDDPLSAVDARVGNRLFNECINGYLKGKTRILVTHQLQYLKEADKIIVINNGLIEYQGNLSELQKSDNIYKYLNLSDVNQIESTENTESDRTPILTEPSHLNEVAEDGKEESEETEKLLNHDNSTEKIKGKEPSKETTEITKKRRFIYWKYFTIGGSYLLPIAAITAFIGAQLFCSLSDYFVTYWTMKQSRLTLTEKSFMANETIRETIREQSLDLYSITEEYLHISVTSVFGILIAGVIVMSILKMILYTATIQRSNEKLHNEMVVTLLGAKMPFFETNDSGKILNRFTKDLGSADERLQMMMLESLEYLFIILGVGVQIIAVNYWSIIVIIVMGYVFWKSRSTAIKTIRSITRLEAEEKSPVFSYVNTSLSGLMTIRSCRVESMACKEFDTRQDNHTAAASIAQFCLQSFSFWLDLISLVFTAIVIYFFIFYGSTFGQITGAEIGLTMTQMLIMCALLARGIRLTSDINSQMVPVERLLQYTELDQEIDPQINLNRPKSWPSQGKIEFNNVSLRYSQNDEPILKYLTFIIEPGAKIGIVGRTGAGKSSLIAALFQLASTEGSMLIDGVDTKKIELKHLRDKISILPQEPILFSVSLRKNLDPQEKLDDASLWSALQAVELNKEFATLDQTLDQNNLSSGQRQLLCLARAILKKNKILVLDEATANVDTSTDALIQKTIRTKFEDCTVLIIAHRLNTVMDCDKIMVMSHGRILEYDSPDVLKQKDGYFSKMLRQSAISST